MDWSDIMFLYVEAFRATDQAQAINPMNGLFLCGPQGHFLTAEHWDTVTAISYSVKPSLFFFYEISETKLSQWLPTGKKSSPSAYPGRPAVA